jgi:ATP synthase protein I
MKDSPRQDLQALHGFQRQIARRAFAASVIIAALLFGFGFKPVARGLLLGSLFSVLNFVIMAYALPRQIGFTRRKATGFALVSILLRFGLLALPLIIGFKFDMFNWIAVAAGLFAVPLAIFIDQVIVQRFYPNRVHP